MKKHPLRKAALWSIIITYNFNRRGGAGKPITMPMTKKKKTPEADGITYYYSGVEHTGDRQMFYTYTDELSRIHMIRSDFTETFQAHTHEFVEIVCVMDGYGIHHLDGERLRVRCGDIFLIDYGMTHSFEPISGTLTVINCIFRPEFLGGNYPVLNNAVQLLSYLHDHRLHPHTDISAGLCRRNLRSEEWDGAAFFEDMMREYENRSADYTAVLRSMLSILLTRLSRDIFTETGEGKEAREDTPADNSFDRILPDIVRCLNQSPPGSISAKSLADQYFMSQSAFSTHFRRAMGCTYLDYVTSLRIRHACALLLTTDCPVSEIQSRCGYSDSKSFYHAFRGYTGMTPLKYKAANRAEKL